MRPLVLALLLAVPAGAPAQAPPLLAVLDFDSPDDALPDTELDLLTDALRKAVKKEMGAQFKVMTKETMREIVPPEQQKCLAGKCVVDIARTLQAPYALAGNVKRLGAKKVLTVEAYESKGGQLLGSEQLRGANAEELFDALDKQARGLVRAWLGGGAGEAAVKPAVAEAKLGGGSTDFDVASAEEVVAAFESEPAGAVVLLDGKVVCQATPCSRTVAAGSRQVTMSLEQYDDAVARVALSKANKRVRLTLPAAFGEVTIESVPPGLPVLIDGRLKGDAPVTERLGPGPHELIVRDRCHAEAGERIVVEKGRARTVRIAPPEKLAAVKVSAADDAGNDVEAEVAVDGRPIGSTPVTAKVPMCSTELVVTANGTSRREALALKEKAVKAIAVVFPARRTVAANPAPSVAAGACPEGMVFIPGGSFDMGSNDGDEDERPVHRVTVSAFCLDRTEHAESNGLPTVNVDWNTAKATCEREGKRLPTEAEWEYAARGTQGRKYPWGNTEPSCDKANYGQCGGSAKRVGSLPAGATPEGVQDLAGNVWEWVFDCYDNYTSAAQKDPLIEQKSCQYRVIRGGGFDFNAANMRASNRDRNGPWNRISFLGFRCARGMAR